jgi:hypothetical protein
MHSGTFKCGILAREGVVPSELGYGYYCGNFTAISRWVTEWL